VLLQSRVFSASPLFIAAPWPEQPQAAVAASLSQDEGKMDLTQDLSFLLSLGSTVDSQQPASQENDDGDASAAAVSVAAAAAASASSDESSGSSSDSSDSDRDDEDDDNEGTSPMVPVLVRRPAIATNKLAAPQLIADLAAQWRSWQKHEGGGGVAATASAAAARSSSSSAHAAVTSGQLQRRLNFYNGAAPTPRAPGRGPCGRRAMSDIEDDDDDDTSTTTATTRASGNTDYSSL
jgi:hypothetical protein